MSKLSKKKSIKRKRQRKKERNKPKIILKSSEKLDPDLVVKLENGLKITIVRLIGIRHKPLKVGNCIYKSAADFSVDKGWLTYWGRAFDITRDIHGHHVIYWKQRFPLFDEFDYELDERHFRIMLICSSREEAEKKKAFIQNSELRVTDFEYNLYCLLNSYGEEKYRYLLPFVYYEDSVRAFAVEIQNE